MWRYNPMRVAMWRRVFSILFFMGCCATYLCAQQYDYSAYARSAYLNKPRSAVEMGLMAGAAYMHTSSSAIDLTPNAIGVRGALSMSICWDEAYAFQMELAYIYNEMEASLGGFSADVKSNVMEIPLLFSYRALGPVRLNVGPVLSIGGTARYEVGIEKVEFGRMRSTLGYMVGAAVSLTPHLLLDARFVGNFAKPLNYFEGCEFSTPNYWAVLSLGYMF